MNQLVHNRYAKLRLSILRLHQMTLPVAFRAQEQCCGGISIQVTGFRDFLMVLVPEASDTRLSQ